MEERIEYKFAGLLPRFVALLIDLLVFCIIFFPITYLVKGKWIMSPTDHLWNRGLIIFDPLCLFFLCTMFVYAVILEGLFGGTIGKLIIGLNVIGPNGSHPGLLRGLVRNVLRIVDGLPFLNIVGIILIVRSEERVRFGDRIAKTRVVIRSPYGSVWK
jgi:uncharacterized RDD family membrane protein YckC